MLGEGSYTRAELDAEQGMQLPDKEVISLLDLFVNIDLALDLAAPIDLAIAANANLAAPIDGAVTANVLSFGSVAQALGEQAVQITQSIDADATATAPQTAMIDQSNDVVDGGTSGTQTVPVSSPVTDPTGTTAGTVGTVGDTTGTTGTTGTTAGTVGTVGDTTTGTVGTVGETVNNTVDTVGSTTSGLTEGLFENGLLNVNVDLALDADIAAPIAGAVAANANAAAPIDAAVSANIASFDSVSTAVANQTAIIDQSITGSATATAEQNAEIIQ